MKPGEQETVSFSVSYYTVITVFYLQPAVDQVLTQSNKTLLKSMATNPRETTLTWQYMPPFSKRLRKKSILFLYVYSLWRGDLVHVQEKLSYHYDKHSGEYSVLPVCPLSQNKAKP